MATDDPVPHGITGPGLELWRDLHDVLEFDCHERALVTELCRSVTLADMLAREVDVLGVVVDGQRGPKANPLVAELRQQRLVIARLVASLGIPEPDGAARPNRRGAARGVYRLKTAD